MNPTRPKIAYESLNARQQEVYNFQKISALLADYGFSCLKLSDDWQGADFIAYHMQTGETLKVQLKGRVTIDKKYIGKQIHIAFCNLDDWYLVEHDILINLVEKHTNWLGTHSWIGKGNYHSGKPSISLMAALSPFRL